MSALVFVPDLLVQWWKKADRVNRIIVGFFLVGVAFVGLSILPKPGLDAAWIRDVLMTVGSSIALFSPFYLLTRSLDTHISQVRDDTARNVQEVREEAAASVSHLTDEVTAIRQHVDERLAEFSSRVTARLAEEAAADTAAFAALRLDAPSRDAVTDAFRRAIEMGLVAENRPPRVSVSDVTHVYVSIDYNPQAEDEGWDTPNLEFRLEDIEGHVQESIPWEQDRDPADVLVDLGRALRKHTGDVFDPAKFFAGMADLLEAANTHPHRRPAVQLCPPQWLVTTERLVPYDEPNRASYTLPHHRLRAEGTLANHVMDKGWVDKDSFDDAVEVSRMLFPPSPWDSGDPQF